MVSLGDLIIHPGVREAVLEALASPRGIIAVNGDAGSGKTTVMLAMAHELRRRGHRCHFIFTDADNEKFLRNISGREDWDVRLVDDTTAAWTTALAEAPPDAVLVLQELDYRTAKLYVDEARRGRTILTVISTPYIGIDAAYSVRKNGVATTDFLALFSSVTSQFLVPKPCLACRTQATIDVEEARQVDPGATHGMTVWREVGCAACEGKGTKGLNALQETLRIDDATRPVLANYLEHGDLHNPLPEGHITIHQAARDLLRDGELGFETFKREITQNPILRMQHQWDLERRQATRVRDMFSRFVTAQVADRMLAHGDAQAIMEGERRLVTCMFADIRGFTTISEAMAPHDLFRLLNRYFREIIRIVADQGGTIDKFVGDCVMVLFGAPVEQPDPEYRAVRSAQAILRCVAALNAERAPAPPIEMGIGINTGEAVTGCLGSDQRMDYTALGDAVNTASRLESRAGAGQIVIGPATARAVSGRIPCTPLGALKLKGKAEEIEAFVVLP